MSENKNSSAKNKSSKNKSKINAAADHPVNGKKKSNKKTMWVDVQKCFECGKHGHNLPKCNTCKQAFYCNVECQRNHWKKHRPVCRSTVAALALHATRQRAARAVRAAKAAAAEGSAASLLPSNE